MAVMNRAVFAKQLEEGLNTIFGMEYEDRFDEWTPVFPTYNSKKAQEEDVLSIGFGPAPNRGEGAPIEFDSGGEAWSQVYFHEEVAMGFLITQRAIEDGLYGNLGAKYSRQLARAFKESKEIKHADIFNRSVNTSYPGGDGKPLLATDHPLAGGGTWSNKLSTPADFAEASLEAILIQARKNVDERGIPIRLNPKGLVLPPDLEFESVRLLRSEYRPATDLNDVNAINRLSIFKKDPHILTRLVDTDAWYVLTDVAEGLKHFDRIKLSTKMTIDPYTDNLMFRGREVYSQGFSNARAVFGSEGAG